MKEIFCQYLKFTEHMQLSNQYDKIDVKVIRYLSGIPVICLVFLCVSFNFPEFKFLSCNFTPSRGILIGLLLYLPASVSPGY